MNVPIGIVAWLAGRRVLANSRPGAAGVAPDYPGAVLIALTLSALVLGITEGPTWGWSSAPVIGCFAGALVVGTIFLWRSARHPEPVLDLTLFRARSFSVANAATFLYAMGFFADAPREHPVPHERVALPDSRGGPGGDTGPARGRCRVRPCRPHRVSHRFPQGARRGFTVFVAGLAWFATRVGLQHDYLTAWLPGTLIIGLGIGLTFPVLGAAAVSSLHPDRFAVGAPSTRPRGRSVARSVWRCWW